MNKSVNVRYGGFIPERNASFPQTGMPVSVTDRILLTGPAGCRFLPGDLEIKLRILADGNCPVREQEGGDGGEAGAGGVSALSGVSAQKEVQRFRTPAGDGRKRKKWCLVHYI